MPETAVCVCVYLCECFLNFNIAYLFVLITSFYSDKLADMTPCCALYSASFLSISNYNLQLKHLIVFWINKNSKLLDYNKFTLWF